MNSRAARGDSWNMNVALLLSVMLSQAEPSSPPLVPSPPSTPVAVEVSAEIAPSAPPLTSAPALPPAPIPAAPPQTTAPTTSPPPPAQTPPTASVVPAPSRDEGSGFSLRVLATATVNWPIALTGTSFLVGGRAELDLWRAHAWFTWDRAGTTPRRSPTRTA